MKNYKELEKAHIESLKLIRNVKTYERRITSNLESLNGIPGQIIDTRNRLLKEVQHYNKSIARLQRRYNEQVNKINDLLRNENI